MKLLDGKELAGFITERQARQVRALRQARKVFPKLAIIVTTDDPVIDAYVRLKQRYGQDILIDTDVRRVDQSQALGLVQELNADASVHGIIVQLPLSDPSQTDEIVNAIAPEKDVDGLSDEAVYESATAEAIDWLLAGYNVNLTGREIAIVGLGRLVGAPLLKRWEAMGLNVTGYDDQETDLANKLKTADVIVTATGVPGLIKSSMLAPGVVIVDAGTASENGQIVGDVSSEVHERHDITITPIKGGVGPLTIAALFDHVILAAQATAGEN